MSEPGNRAHVIKSNEIEILVLTQGNTEGATAC